MTPQTLDWDPRGPHSADIYLGQRVVGRYVWSPDFRQPFFHPLFTAKSPSPVSLYAPADHPWHRGLWWAWKYVNGVNFWDDTEQDASQSGFGTSQVVGHEVFKLATGGFTVSQRLELRQIQTNALIATERRKLTLHPVVPGTSPGFSGWAIDWDATWTSDQELTFSTTPREEKPWGGYGGLNFRPARSFCWREEISNSQGGRGAQEVHGIPTRWACIRGGCDGDPNVLPREAPLAGLAFLIHPGNPEAAQSVFVHAATDPKRGFGILKTAPLMRGPLTIATGEKLRLRYRVVLFDSLADLPVEALDAAWEKYAKG
jgi:hypothetical protein